VTAGLRQVLDRFEAAGRDRTRLRAAAGALADAAGFRDLADSVADPALLNRPWEYVLAGIEGDPLLAARAYAVAVLWDRLTAPDRRPGDWIDFRLSPVPAVLRPRLVAAAVPGLRALPPDQVLCGIPVAELLRETGQTG
jgi:hypothetical protein